MAVLPPLMDCENRQSSNSYGESAFIDSSRNTRLDKRIVEWRRGEDHQAVLSFRLLIDLWSCSEVEIIGKITVNTPELSRTLRDFRLFEGASWTSTRDFVSPDYSSIFSNVWANLLLFKMHPLRGSFMIGLACS